MTEAIALTLWGTAGLWTAAAGTSSVALAQRAPRPALAASGRWLAVAGACALAALVGWLWISLGRPPLRTLGETRLWYALLLPVIGLVVEWRLKAPELRLPMLGFGILFVAINLAKPDTLDKTLMPALQSPWFVPHVVVYMVSYAALGLSCGAALWALGKRAWRREACVAADLALPMLLVRIGLPFLTLGLLFGALWAKEAWGHYWTWDPKETWAFLTWAAYVAVLHAAPEGRLAPRRHLVLVAASFAVVLACWFLLNMMPAANASVHTYTQS